MKRTNVPSPIRTTGGDSGYNNYPTDAHQQDPRNTSVDSHEHHYYSNDNHDTSSHDNHNNMIPTSAMRQGRFLTPQHGGGDINAQQYQQQVTFQPGAAPSDDSALNSPFNNAMASSFMFDDIEDFHHYSSQTNDHNSPHPNNNSGIPTEAQLTLLCLDYLRSLRRSYQNPQDLLNGEGLHADYISLAVWSLSRAFVSLEKLQHGVPKVSTIIEESEEGKRKNKSSKVKEIRIVGGGGLAGVEDECVGNDSFYRLDVKNNDGDSEMNIGITPPREVFALTDAIKLPSMKDITNEVLLSYNTTSNDAGKSNEECAIYEQNDMHLSNSHRFYLFNGMASGDDSIGMMGGANNAKKASVGPSIVDGGPLTLTDLASVALSTLNAKSRIEAEREVVHDPLFESFINAASEKGFFKEKKLDGEDMLSPEAEEHRQRLLFESKYRKVVAKFRSKLAVREEQQMLHYGGGAAGGGGVWSPRSGQRALRNVHSVSDRLEMRRDRIIEQVKEYRVEEEKDSTSFVPHSLSKPGPVVASYEREEQPAIGAVVTEPEHHSVRDVVASYEREKQPVAVVAGYEQDTPQRAESDEEIQTDEEMVVEHETEVEQAPITPPSPVVAPPSPAVSPHVSKKEIMDPPLSPDNAAAKVPPSPAAKLPFYQEAESLNTQGNDMMMKKQFSKALEFYSAALKKSPAGPHSHVYYSNRAAAHLSLGDAESSIQDSQLALTIRPDYVKAHSRLGLAHYASGRYEEAVANYEAALDLEPENQWVNNQYKKARRTLMKMQEEKEVPTEDDDGDLLVSLAKKAAQDIIRKADEHKDNGNAFMKNKKFEEALHQYNLAIDTSADGPNSHIYYSNRAAAYCYLGQYSEAADDCLSSIELNDSYEKAYSRYGLSLFFLGDYEGSIDAYRKSLELAPDNKASLSYLAKARSRLAEQQENEMQEDMAKKLNLGNKQDDLGVGNDELDKEIEQDGHGGRNVVNDEFSQSRDDEGEGVEVSPPSQAVDPPAFDPFNTDEGDEI